MSNKVIKSKNKKYKIKDDASEILEQLNITPKNKTKKKTNLEVNPPKQNPTASPASPAPPPKQNPLASPAPPPKQNPTAPPSPPPKQNPPAPPLKKNNDKIKSILKTQQTLIQKPTNNVMQNNVPNKNIKSITIDLNYALDGGKQPSKRKMKEINHFFSNKASKYNNTVKNREYNPAIDRLQQILEKDKDVKNYKNNISSISVNKINQIFQNNIKRSPHHDNVRLINSSQNSSQNNTQNNIQSRHYRELQNKKSITNQNQMRNLIYQIRKRELENNKLKQELVNFQKNNNLVNNNNKSKSVIILEKKRQEILNQQRKEIEK